MALLTRSPERMPPGPGILATRRQAEPGLLRILSRARRRKVSLLLLRLNLHPAPQQAPERCRPFLLGLTAGVRMHDLCWWDDECGALLLLLEEAESELPVAERLERRAQASGLELRLATARFPEQGLTLQALVEAVA